MQFECFGCGKKRTSPGMCPKCVNKAVGIFRSRK